VLHYIVDWHPTLMPEHSLGNVKEQVDKFEARLQAQRKIENRRARPGLTSQSAVAYSKTRHVQLRHSAKRVPWTEKEDESLLKMKEEDGLSWEEISYALPLRTRAAIQIRYSMNLGGGRGSGKRRRP
jgi:hypothetical protein